MHITANSNSNEEIAQTSGEEQEAGNQDQNDQEVAGQLKGVAFGSQAKLPSTTIRFHVSKYVKQRTASRLSH
jgi:hypothetical protein